MKTNDNNMLKNIPDKVLYVQMCASLGHPIGIRLYEETITEYPEYFTREVEIRKKWASIPEEVHEQHRNELNNFRSELWKDSPPPGGIMSAINNDENYQKWSKSYEERRPLEIKKEEELHKKYYSKYGV